MTDKPEVPAESEEPELETRGPYNFDDPEFARKAGAKGGLATADKFKRKGLKVTDLRDLETPADVKRWLEVVSRGVLTRKIEARDADAAIRALKAWLDANGAEMASGLFKGLADEVAELRRMVSMKAS